MRWWNGVVLYECFIDSVFIGKVEGIWDCYDVVGWNGSRVCFGCILEMEVY